MPDGSTKAGEPPRARPMPAAPAVTTIARPWLIGGRPREVSRQDTSFQAPMSRPDPHHSSPDRIGRAGSVAVLRVGDVIQPRHDLAVLVGLLYRDMRHEAVDGRPVPVLLARLDVDDVARANLLDLAAPASHIADAVGD